MTDLIPFAPDDATPEVLDHIEKLNQRHRKHEAYIEKFEREEKDALIELNKLIEATCPFYPATIHRDGIKRAGRIIRGEDTEHTGVFIRSKDTNAHFEYEAQPDYTDETLPNHHFIQMTTNRGIMGASAPQETFTKKAVDRMKSLLADEGLKITRDWSFNGGHSFYVELDHDRA